jgi:hypothetical protein
MPTELPVLWLPVLPNTQENRDGVQRTLARILPNGVYPVPFTMDDVSSKWGCIWGFYSREVVVAFYDPEDGNTT